MAADVRSRRPSNVHVGPGGAGNWVGRVTIKNSGRGPALFVRATLDPVNSSPDNWSLGAIAQGDRAELTFSHLAVRDSMYQLLLDYNDLAGRLYSSALVIDFPTPLEPDPPRMSTGRFYDVKLFEDVRVTGHGDAMPQPGLKPVGPPPRRSRTRRFRDMFSGAARGARDAYRNKP